MIKIKILWFKFVNVLLTIGIHLLGYGGAYIIGIIILSGPIFLYLDLTDVKPWQVSYAKKFCEDRGADSYTVSPDFGDEVDVECSNGWRISDLGGVFSTAISPEGQMFKGENYKTPYNF